MGGLKCLNLPGVTERQEEGAPCTPWRKEGKPSSSFLQRCTDREHRRVYKTHLPGGWFVIKADADQMRVCACVYINIYK